MTASFSSAAEGARTLLLALLVVTAPVVGAAAFAGTASASLTNLTIEAVPNEAGETSTLVVNATESSSTKSVQNFKVSFTEASSFDGGFADVNDGDVRIFVHGSWKNESAFIKSKSNGNKTITVGFTSATEGGKDIRVVLHDFDNPTTEKNYTGFFDVNPTSSGESGYDEMPIVDTTPPDVRNATITDATDSNGVVSDGDTVHVTANVSETGTLASVTADASGFGAGDVSLSASGDGVYEGTFTVSTTDSGTPSVTVTATDSGGNSDSDSSNTLELNPSIDLLAPNASDPVYTQPNASLTVNYTSSSNVESADIVLSGPTTVEATGQPATGPTTLDLSTFDLPDGNYTVRAVGNDDSGTDLVSDEHADALVVDSNASRVNVTAPSDVCRNTTGPVTVEYTATDPQGVQSVTVELLDASGSVVDSAAGTAGTAQTTNLSAPSEGTYDARVRVTDDAGNTASDTNRAALVVDTTAPNVTVTNFSETVSVRPGENVTVRYNATDGGPGDAAVTVSLVHNGTTVASADGSLGTGQATTLTVPSDGPAGNYTARVRAVDCADNSDHDARMEAVSVDGFSPVANVTTNATVYRQPGENVTLEYAASDPDGDLASVGVALLHEGSVVVSAAATGGENTSATLSLPADAPEGDYTARVTATDAVGRSDSDSARAVAVVDSTPPTALVVAPNDTRTVSPEGTVTVEYRATDDEGVADVSLVLTRDGSVVARNESVGSTAGASNGTATATFTLPETEEATYRVELRVTDVAGLSDSDAQANAFRVEEEEVEEDTDFTLDRSTPTATPTATPTPTATATPTPVETLVSTMAAETATPSRTATPSPTNASGAERAGKAGPGLGLASALAAMALLAVLLARRRPD